MSFTYVPDINVSSFLEESYDVLKGNIIAVLEGFLDMIKECRATDAVLEHYKYCAESFGWPRIEVGLMRATFSDYRSVSLNGITINYDVSDVGVSTDRNDIVGKMEQYINDLRVSTKTSASSTKHFIFNDKSTVSVTYNALAGNLNKSNIGEYPVGSDEFFNAAMEKSACELYISAVFNLLCSYKSIGISSIRVNCNLFSTADSVENFIKDTVRRGKELRILRTNVHNISTELLNGNMDCIQDEETFIKSIGAYQTLNFTTLYFPWAA